MEKENKTGKERKRKAYRAPTQQAHLPAQPSHRSSELIGLARQASSCSTASTACMPRSCSPPRRSPRRAVALGRTPPLSRAPRHTRSLSGSLSRPPRYRPRRHHRRRVQRRPHALSPCPDGSPSSTTSTSQAARRRSPCNVAVAVVFNLGPPEIAITVPTAPSLPRAR